MNFKLYQNYGLLTVGNDKLILEYSKGSDIIANSLTEKFMNTTTKLLHEAKGYSVLFNSKHDRIGNSVTRSIINETWFYVSAKQKYIVCKIDKEYSVYNKDTGERTILHLLENNEYVELKEVVSNIDVATFKDAAYKAAIDYIVNSRDLERFMFADSNRVTLSRGIADTLLEHLNSSIGDVVTIETKNGYVYSGKLKSLSFRYSPATDGITFHFAVNNPKSPCGFCDVGLETFANREPSKSHNLAFLF